MVGCVASRLHRTYSDQVQKQLGVVLIVEAKVHVGGLGHHAKHNFQMFLVQ